MKKKADSTGIYRNILPEAIDWNDYRAVQRAMLEDDSRLLNLDRLITEAEQFAQDILERYTVSSDDSSGRPIPISKGVPHNVRYQVDEAFNLREHARDVRESIEKGDAAQAALNGYWAGFFYERLRVRQYEYVAKLGRGPLKGQRNAVETKKKQGTMKRARLVKEAQGRWKDNPNLTVSAIARIISKQTGEGFEGIRTHLKGLHPPKKLKK